MRDIICIFSYAWLVLPKKWVLILVFVLGRKLPKGERARYGKRRETRRVTNASLNARPSLQTWPLQIQVVSGEITTYRVPYDSDLFYRTPAS